MRVHLTLLLIALVMSFATRVGAADPWMDAFAASVAGADSVSVVGTIQAVQLGEIEKINVEFTGKAKVDQLIAILSQCELFHAAERFSLDEEAKLVPAMKMTFKKDGEILKSITYSRWTIIVFENGSCGVVQTPGHYGRLVGRFKKLQEKK